GRCLVNGDDEFFDHTAFERRLAARFGFGLVSKPPEAHAVAHAHATHIGFDPMRRQARSIEAGYGFTRFGLSPLRSNLDGVDAPLRGAGRAANKDKNQAM